MVTVIKQHRQYGRHASLLPEIHLLGELCYRTRIVFTKTNLLASDANYPGGSFTRSNPTNNDGPEGAPCRIPQPTPHYQNLTRRQKTSKANEINKISRVQMKSWAEQALEKLSRLEQRKV
jgi:hypothetical protein